MGLLVPFCHFVWSWCVSRQLLLGFSKLQEPQPHYSHKIRDGGWPLGMNLGSGGASLKWEHQSTFSSLMRSSLGFFVTTFNNTDPFASFLGLATSPAAHFKSFWIAKMDNLIGSWLFALIKRNLDNELPSYSTVVITLPDDFLFCWNFVLGFWFIVLGPHRHRPAHLSGEGRGLSPGASPQGLKNGIL